MGQKVELDQEVLNDAELFALLCETEKEIEEHGESNQPNLLLRDFAQELLKYRLSGFAAIVRRIGLRPADVEDEPLDEPNQTEISGRRYVTDSKDSSTL